MRKAAVLFLFVTLLATQSVLLGQVASGTINVQVQDSSRALVPGGSVTLKHTGTG